MKRELSTTTKLSIFIRLLVPILTYGYESWVMTEKVGSLVQISEMSFLRRIEEVSDFNKARSSEIRKPLNIEPVAYAGFSEGGGGGGGAGNSENLRTTKTTIKIFPPVRFPARIQVKTKKKRKKRSSIRFSPVFGPKLGEGQKKVFAHRLCAQTFCPSCKGGRGGMA